MSKKIRVGVLFGGQSMEHEVSRVSATSILNAIDRERYDVACIGITKEGRWLPYHGPVEKLSEGAWEEHVALSSADTVTTPAAQGLQTLHFAGQEPVDVVFPVLHGTNGEDGTVQGLLELAGVPYVGCGVLASAVGMDKAYSKVLFEKAGIPQGRYVAVNRRKVRANVSEVAGAVAEQLGFPCFVKPSNAGSSVGVGKARDREELEAALLEAIRYDHRVIIEEFIDGRELEVAVLGNDEPVASVVGEIIPSNEFYDYRAKYVDNASRIVIPADIPSATAEMIRKYAVDAYLALDCAGLSRVDFFLHKDSGKIYINEINTLPGFTSISMYPKLWEATGIPYKDLISRLIDLAFERHEDRRRDFRDNE